MTTKTSQAAASTIAFRKVAIFVAAVGALNWGLIGLFDWNLVDALLGGGAIEQTSTGSRIVYAIIGLAGLVSLLLMPTPSFSADNVRPDL
jgi:uncharacterized membrane protein YuzA (DUF378 family)